MTTWVIAYGNYAAAGRNLPAVRSVLNYFYGPQGQSTLPELGYAPLPASLLEAAQAQLNSLT